MYHQDCNSQQFETEHQQVYPQSQGFRAQEQLYGNNAPQHPANQQDDNQYYPNQEDHFVAQEHSKKPERYLGRFPEYFSHKCHGTKAAIEMKPSLTRGGWHTVSLEAASSIGVRKFDWKNKTIIQITQSELLPLIAVLLGIRQGYDGKNHGTQSNKGFNFKWQNQDSNLSLFSSLFEANKKATGVPISAYDAMMLGHQALSQYLLNFPQLTPESVLMSLKQVHRYTVR